MSALRAGGLALFSNALVLLGMAGMVLRGAAALIEIILGARWLGHGRALEAFLALICAIYAGILLLVPGAAFQSQATAQFVWEGVHPIWIAMPFILKTVFTTIGLYRNIQGLSWSRFYRIVGALIGTFTWSWYLTQFIAYDAVGALGTATCIGGIVASIRIIGMAGANLPPPGAPGQLGVVR